MKINTIICLLMVGLLASCSKNSNQEIESSSTKKSEGKFVRKTSSISPDTLANWHTESCNYIMNNYSPEAMTGVGLITDYCNIMRDFLVYTKGIDSTEVDNTIDTIIATAIADKSLMNRTVRMSPATISLKLTNVANIVGLSNEFKDSLIQLYTRTYNGFYVDSASLMSSIDFILDDNNWSGGDLYYAQAVRKIAFSSNTFWAGRPVQGGHNVHNGGAWDCTQWVIFNDGLGAVFGAPFGGIGSAIFGTYLSMGTYKDCKDKPAGSSYF